MKFKSLFPRMNSNSNMSHTVYASQSRSSTYYAWKMLDGQDTTYWTNLTHETAYLYFTFPTTKYKNFHMNKIMIQAVNDPLLFKKAPTKFSVYGVKDEDHLTMNYRESVLTYDKMAFTGMDLLLEVDEGFDFWSQGEKKEWILDNPSSQPYYRIFIHMYDKGEAFGQANEYAIQNLQFYQAVPEEEKTIIENISDSSLVSIHNDKIPFGGINILNVENEHGYDSFINGTTPYDSYYFSMGNNNDFAFLSQKLYTEGKWYYELTMSSNGMVGWYEYYGLNNNSTEYHNETGLLLYHNGSFYGMYEGSGKINNYTETINNKVIGCAIDIDNGTIEYFIDGLGQGKVKMRTVRTPVVPVVTYASSTVKLNPEPLYKPKGYTNIIGKGKENPIITKLDSASVENIKKYGVSKGQVIDFEKPYNKVREFNEESSAYDVGTLYTIPASYNDGRKTKNIKLEVNYYGK